MAWSMTQLADGTWDWTVTHSPYGVASGHNRTFPSALLRMTLAESAMLAERPTPEKVAALEGDPEGLLRARAGWIEDAIGTNVKPLDPASFLLQLHDHEGVEDRL